MAVFEPPPTYAEVIVIDKKTNKARFNPIWLKWFIDLVGFLNASGGGGGGGIDHNLLTNLQGGTANQYYHTTAAQNTAVGTLTGTTYTPTLTNVANLDASTAYQCQYMRISNTVFVSGRVDVDPTLAATSTKLGISLPVASNIGATEDVGGAAFASGIAGQGASILGDAANDRAQMQWLSGDVTNQAMYFTFGYQII